MVANENRAPANGGTDFAYSLYRSVVTYYWMFTVVVMAFTAVGFSLAGAFRLDVAVVSLVAIYVGLEGLHDLDLTDPEIALQVDPTVQTVVGVVLIATASSLGAWLAFQTTPWFFAFVFVEVFLGFAYNLEWFDGLLHDLDKYGAHNFGLSWGAIPLYAGYFLMDGNLTLGVLVFGAAAAALSACLLVLYELVKVPVLYDSLGVEHDREYDRDGEQAAVEANDALSHLIRGLVLLGVGAYVYGVLGI